MEYRELCYKSANKANDIYAYVWEPQPEIDAVGILQISHGMGEHAQRYAPFAEFMCEKGFIVCANDHIGHGRSANGKFGYMGEKNGFKVLAKDTYKLFNIMRADYADVPYIILGHDMGSLIARYICSLWGLEVDGAIFSGTCGETSFSRPATAFLGFLANIKGAEFEAAGAYKRLRSKYNKYFREKGVQATGDEWLTRDKEQLRLYNEDPLCGFPLTLSGYRDFAKLRQITTSPKWAQRIPKNLRVYLFSGLDDPFGDFGSGVLDTYQLLTETGCENIDIKLYEDARHEMLFEINKDEVYNDVLNWILDNVINAQ